VGATVHILANRADDVHRVAVWKAVRAAYAIVRRRTLGCERREKLEGSAHDALNSFTAGNLAVRGVSEDTNAFRAPLSHLYASQLVRQRPSRRVVVAPRDLSETNADLDVAVVRRHIGV
jgi:hypothetical protein